MQTYDIMLARVGKIAHKLPWSTDDACIMLHRLAVAMQAKEILEVATGHGKSTLYLAAAVYGTRGRLRSVDNMKRYWRGSSPSGRLRQAGLASRCRLATQIDARWYLIDLFSAYPGRWVDLAFLDASHVVEADSFLALSLWTHLRPGGVLVMDDLDWTAAVHGQVSCTSSRPATPHMRALFDYVRSLPDVAYVGQWGESEIFWSYGMIQKGPRPPYSFNLKAFLRKLPAQQRRRGR